VTGQVSPINDRNSITIGRTADTNRIPFPISDALVVLTDDQGNTWAYENDPEKQGRYILDIQGQPGVTYFVTITLPTGEIYESVPERIPLNYGSDSVYHTFEDKEFTDFEGTVSTRHYMNIFTNAKFSAVDNQTLFIKWSIDEVYKLSPTDFPDPFGDIPPPCYISQYVDAQRVNMFNGEESTATEINDLFLATRLIDYSFHERHYFRIFQSSLSREAFEYWRNVNALVSQVGSIFDTPPAKIRGNIFNVNDSEEEVHGYFQAANETSQRFFTIKQDIPYFLQVFCLYGADREYLSYPSICLDCTSAANSTYNRPPWF
jgi:hypothetical protein